jgi:phosphoglycerate dehydrogenase-like enzyme
MKKAALIGAPALLADVYPPAARGEIAGCYALRPGEIDGADWAAQAGELSEVEVLFATWGMPRLDADFLAAAPRLRAVFYAAGSVKGFATPGAERAGLVICSAVEANGVPVAEYSLAAILLSLKGFWGYQRQRPEDKFRRDAAVVHGAYGSTVGLVSLGSIGRRLAAMLRSHEVNVLAYDPYLTPQTAEDLGVTPCELPGLFARSEVVSVHTPWLPETEKLIGAGLLGSMKRGATLINTSRGAVIDEDALCGVLRERSDLTAVLDVTHPEPPSADSPLRYLPNVVLTPHVAGSVGPEVERMGWWMVEEARRYLLGHPLQHQVAYGSLARRA